MTNGKLEASKLVSLKYEKAQRLRKDAAASWNRLDAEFHKAHGKHLELTDSYRPYSVQERIFKERYSTGDTGRRSSGAVKKWNGRTYFLRWGVAVAATPGTSNHGWGIALDVSNLGGFYGTDYRRLAAIAAKHGWSNTEGRRINEPWHWVYNSKADRMKGRKPAAKRATGTLREGSRGAKVTRLQRTLNKNYPAYSKLKADGVFGPATEKVVREFQRRSGLVVDGIAGPRTHSKLGL